jgi:hypothetical protein
MEELIAFMGGLWLWNSRVDARPLALGPSIPIAVPGLSAAMLKPSFLGVLRVQLRRRSLMSRPLHEQIEGVAFRVNRAQPKLRARNSVAILTPRPPPALLATRR